MNLSTYTKLNNTKGFTIVEMIVVMGIFLIVAGIVIFNFGSFRSSVSVENLAQDIALTIRKAQVYAVSVKSADLPGNLQVFPGYGVHFQLPGSVPVKGTNKSFVFFADVPPNSMILKGNGVYDQTNVSCLGAPLFGDECLEIVSITSADQITDLCATVNSTTTCYNATSSPTPMLDIAFNRPDPEAQLCLSLAGSCVPAVSNVIIKIKSLAGITKSITVWNTGQISVQ